MLPHFSRSLNPGVRLGVLLSAFSAVFFRELCGQMLLPQRTRRTTAEIAELRIYWRGFTFGLPSKYWSAALDVGGDTSTDACPHVDKAH